MSRAERVYKYVENACLQQTGGFNGVDASEIAESLSIWRNDASVELNRLCEAGALVKRGKKPVKYFLASAPAVERRPSCNEETPTGNLKLENEAREARPLDEAFSSLVGNTGSLKAQITMAKAATLYPPHGLHTLIIGETGVGKSLFAEEMWKYAVQARAFGADPKIPYVVFNCAEYADNPQLLLSQLFGYVKGAFSGANTTRAGLVESANGGILFLDEIHRLSPTGQEMFFMLLDRGRYRMLGDTIDRETRVMIIGATSEDPSSTLLTAFKRRMPVLIQIPNLSERSLHERSALIKLFLCQEANRLGCSISVSSKALKVLLSYKPKANIGDLRNDLQLCCAHSYLSYHTRQSSGPSQDRLRVDIYDLPQKVYSAANMEGSSGIAAQKETSEGISVKPGDSPIIQGGIQASEPIDVYNFVERQYGVYIKENIAQEEIAKRANSDIERFWDETSERLGQSDPVDDSVFRDIVAPGIWELSGEILDKASAAFRRAYLTSTRRALSLHLQQFIERVNSGQIIYNPNIKYIKSTYAAEAAFLQENIESISRRLGVAIPEDELCFLALFLKGSKKEILSKHLGLVIAAHGKSTAASMADFVNQMLCTNKIRAVDAPFGKTHEALLMDVCRVTSEVDDGRGVLILADMGSFLSMRDEIAAKTGVQCRILQNVSLPLALEAARIIQSSELSLQEAYGKLVDCADACYRRLSAPSSGFPPNESTRTLARIPSSDRKPIVLVICATGLGSARKIKEIITERVFEISAMDVMTAGVLDDIPRVVRELGSNLRLIIGTIDPEVEGVPFISATKILSSKGLSNLSWLLEGMGANEPSGSGPARTVEDDILEAFGRSIGQFVSTLPHNQVLTQTKYAVERIEREVYKRPLSSDECIRLYMHVATLFDRLARGEVAEESELYSTAKSERPDLFKRVYEIMDEACHPFEFHFPESELYYMVVSMLGPLAVKAREALPAC